jgi:predicted permease
MSSYFDLLGAVAPVFLMLVTGWALRRGGILRPEADATLLQLGVNVLYPCLITDIILGNEALQKLNNILLPTGIGAGTVLAGFAAASAGAWLLGLKWPQPARTFAFAVGLHNYGFIAIPLVQMLFDRATMGVLFTYTLGVELALWSVGIGLLSGARGTQAWRASLTPPVLAIIGSVTVNLTIGSEWLPGFGRTAIHWLGVCAFPVQLLITGAALSDMVRRAARGFRWPPVIAANVMRLGLLPILLLAFSLLLGGHPELQRVVIVQASMPSAMIPVILARHYGGDTDLAGWIVASTTALGLFVIPLWLKFGLWWAGA